MTNPLGLPDAQAVIYGIGRGAYDDYIWGLERAMKQRRRTLLNIGQVLMSRGDLLELVDTLPPKYRSLESAIVRVVRIPDDKAKVVVKVEKTQLPTFRLGRIIGLPRKWVLCPVSEE